MTISHITLGKKWSGERSAGKPHAPFDVAGTGNGSIRCGHEYRVAGSMARPVLDTAPVPDPTTGLQSFEHLSGQSGQPGARSKLVYQNGKHRIELIETVTKRKLPEEFNGAYEWKGGKNTLRNRFIALGPSRTRWESTCEYRFSSFMLKMMGFFVPGMFRKQNLKFLHNFKAFCEHGRDVRGS